MRDLKSSLDVVAAARLPIPCTELLGLSPPAAGMPCLGPRRELHASNSDEASEKPNQPESLQILLGESAVRL